jgi:carbon starvation protein
MNILFLLAVVAVALILAGRWYAPLIARVLGERPDRTTPAIARNDGFDYVPTRTSVVFAHHYASIAGAGPIVGPILAIYYGWGPVLLWIVLGAILIGAVHDFVATHIAMREGGHNLAVVTKRYVGRTAFLLMLLLFVSILVIICAAFLDLSARALTSKVPLTHLGLSESQSTFRTTTLPDGQPAAIIGGIASTSVIFITLFSPLLGYLYIKKRIAIWICSSLAVVICGVSIAIGFAWPLSISPEHWKYALSGYVLLAAGLPVWLFLQSRDFINVHILYVGILFFLLALIGAGISGGGALAEHTSLPFSQVGFASQRIGPLWPILFITISCGAVSGFHSLCAGGTTCKQLKSEPAARHVGFYAMLLESFFAACVVGCVLVGLSAPNYTQYCYPLEGKPNAVLTFAMAVGHTANIGLNLPVAFGAIGAMLMLEGFLITTLDTAIRLTRYLLEEAWTAIYARDELSVTAGSNSSAVTANPEQCPAVPLLLRQHWFNTSLAVAAMLAVALSNGYLAIWPIFGASNQLLAALALLIASCWLAAQARPVWYTLLPAGFMLVTSLSAICYTFAMQVSKATLGWPLMIATGVALLATLGILICMLDRMRRGYSAHPTVTV